MKPRSRIECRRRRHMRVRKKISGTAERPRMAISCSNKHMYVQFIDDDRSTTLASVSTLGDNSGNNVAAAQLLGRHAAESACSKGIQSVVVDRGGFKFHGRVKAIVDAAATAGLVNSSTVGTGTPAEPRTDSKNTAAAEDPAENLSH